MKAVHRWHFTPLGRVALFLGSVQLAVPVLAMVAVALAWGTYLESTQNATVSKATVYGSWWFIGLMALICVSLVFAVVARYPWKRKHAGFITVHAGLILMIIAGFWSLFGRLEGHLAIEEGQASNQLETDREVLEVAEFNAGQSKVVELVSAPRSAGALSLGGVRIEVLDRWENSAEEHYVADDSTSALRAFEISVNPTASEGEWVAEEIKGGGGPSLDGMAIRVLPDGADWAATTAAKPSASGFAFTLGATRYDVGEVGSEALPGWRIVSVERFAKASVANGKLQEGGGESNPAIDVTITDGKGTTERHTSFEKFPDMVMSKTLEGTASSGARLAPTSASAISEALVLFGPASAPKVGYVSPTGEGRILPSPASLPATIEAGSHRVSILKQFTHARAATRFVKAPPAGERRPVLTLRIGDAKEPVQVAWKAFEAMTGTGRNLLLRYGPQMVELPFTVKLNDFRKMDYPGTEMAMSYESDVFIQEPGKADLPYLIHMNTPYAHAPWKVYQSGFMGENVSIFSVMRDPGLPLTYLGSIVLCVGIYLTFFSRSLSWGHPGIPAPSVLSHKESAHAPSSLASASGTSVPPAAPAPAGGVAADVAVGEPVGAGR
jgi:uncharacterized membrane protein YqjE